MAVRTGDAILKIAIQIKVFPCVKHPPTLDIGTDVCVGKGYTRDVAGIGRPGHIEAIDAQIGGQSTINDLFALLFPVVGVQDGYRVLNRIHNGTGAKGRYDLIGTKLAQFILIKRQLSPPCSSTYWPRFPLRASSLAWPSRCHCNSDRSSSSNDCTGRS